AGEFAEHHDADLTDVEVERHAERAVLELEQLVGHRRGQPLDLGDAVTRVGDDTDLFTGDLRRVGRDVALKGAADLVRGDGQLGHPQPSIYLRQTFGIVTWQVPSGPRR